MIFCSNCGHKVQFGQVPEDEIQRFFCNNCRTIHYQNPKVIVGTIPQWEDQVLLCKRAIEPRYGLWTLPAGFLENGETVEIGAARETLEESKAAVEVGRLFSVYSLPNVGQVYLMFLAKMNDLDYGSGKESLQVGLFRKEQIPWNEIAFSAITFTLQKYFEAEHNWHGQVYLGSSDKRIRSCN